MPTLSKYTKSITQLTSTGTSEWLYIGNAIPTDATFELVWDGASSAQVKFEYSDDGSTVASETDKTTARGGSDTVSYQVSTSYPYVRVNWTDGTATSLDATLAANVYK